MGIYTSQSHNFYNLRQGSWCCEAVLWTPWTHHGTMTAKDNCRICVINASKFQEIVGFFEHSMHFDPRHYAEQFVEELNGTEDEITDLFTVTNVTHEHLGANMAFFAHRTSFAHRSSVRASIKGLPGHPSLHSITRGGTGIEPVREESYPGRKPSMLG